MLGVARYDTPSALRISTSVEMKPKVVRVRPGCRGEK
jgi:hypothetical protein